MGFEQSGARGQSFGELQFRYLSIEKHFDYKLSIMRMDVNSYLSSTCLVLGYWFDILQARRPSKSRSREDDDDRGRKHHFSGKEIRFMMDWNQCDVAEKVTHLYLLRNPILS